jgi:putative colanic acid biosynthesis acetyltransferase WcaF
MPYRNAPVIVESGAWIASCVFVGPGVTIGANSVVSAGSVVTKTVEAFSVVAGNPAVKVKTRVFKG